MDELRKLMAEATPGPWEVSERAKDWRPQVVSTEHGPICTMHIPEIGDADPNAALICAAVNALPELLAIKAERDRAQRACEQMGQRITELLAKVRRLEEALKPFAEIAQYDIGNSEANDDLFRPMMFNNRGPLLTVGMFRRARAALKETGQ